MLNRKTPETLAATIKLDGQGEKSTEAVVFFYRTEEQIREHTAKLDEQFSDNQDAINTGLFCYVVKSVNGHDVTIDSAIEMEKLWPGTSLAFFLEFHRIRRVELAKN